MAARRWASALSSLEPMTAPVRAPTPAPMAAPAPACPLALPISADAGPAQAAHHGAFRGVVGRLAAGHQGDAQQET